MKRRGLVLLAIVAAALAALIVLEGRHRSGGDGHAGARSRMLPAFDRKMVLSITIRRQGGAFSMLHSPSPSAPAPAPGWQIQIEGAPPADDPTIEDLLAAVDLAESDRTADVAPEAAGLSPAVAEIDIATPTGPLALQLGRPDATGQGVYARAGADGPIRVVGRRVLELVDRAPEAFRDRRLFPVDAAAVTSIAWRDETGSGELRAVGGRWQNGRNEWVASERVGESLRRLHALRIERFATAEPSTGSRTLTLTAGATRIALGVGKNDDIVRDGEHLRVPADAFESAWRSLAAAGARDDRLLSLAPDTVARIDLHDGHGRVGLRRVDGAWVFSIPTVPYTADTRVVDEWLTRLGTVKAATRADGPNARHLVVEGRFRQQIDVSSPPDVYALLAPNPLRFRDRAVLSFARFDVRRLKRTAGGDTQNVTTEDGGSWQTSSGATVDPENLSRLVGALSELRAEEFLASPPAGEPAVLLVLELQPPGEPRPAPRVLRVYPRRDDCIARLDTEATFTIDRVTCAALRLELLKKGQ